MAAQIKMLFGVNTPGAHVTLLDVGPDPPQRGGGGQVLNFETPINISRTSAATELKVSVPVDGWGLNENCNSRSYVDMRRVT